MVFDFVSLHGFKRLKMEIIEGFENYTIKFDGTVTRNDGYFMKARIVGGYLQLGLRNSEGKQFNHYIHRLLALHFIANPDNYEFVDHIDGNRLNNNLQNLRWVTGQQNMHNIQKAKGYCFHKRDKKWRARIRCDGVLKHLGYFDTEEDARQAYCAARLLRNAESGANMDFN